MLFYRFATVSVNKNENNIAADSEGAHSTVSHTNQVIGSKFERNVKCVCVICVHLLPIFVCDGFNNLFELYKTARIFLDELSAISELLIFFKSHSDNYLFWCQTGFGESRS